ncbi:MAG: hypothetical protein ACJA1L_000076 [Paracoccaceae bacterium]
MQAIATTFTGLNEANPTTAGGAAMNGFQDRASGWTFSLGVPAITVIERG